MDDNDLKIIQGLKDELGESPLIFDVGANRGNYTDFVLSLIPNANMILIEPNEMWVGVLEKKYGNNPRVKVLNMLIGREVGEREFYYFTNHNDQLSSIYKRPVFSDLPMQECVKKIATIDFVCESVWIEGPDFIKVDTEGAEFDVVVGAVKSLVDKRIKFMQIEYGGTYPDAGITMKEVIKFVNLFGYHVYSYDGTFKRLNAETFIEDFHYDNYLISYIDL